MTRVRRKVRVREGNRGDIFLDVNGRFIVIPHDQVFEVADKLVAYMERECE